MFTKNFIDTTIANSPSGTLIQNAQRQPMESVNQPPSNGPRMAEIPKTAPMMPMYLPRLRDAAAAAGVSRIVYTSLLRADTNTMPLGEEHRLTEKHLKASGVPAVILRNGWYVENFTDQLDTYRHLGALLGASGQARIAPVARADLAAAAGSALLNDDIETAEYELAGPSVTFPELAAALGQATGTELPYRNVSLEDYRTGLIAGGLDENTAGFVTALEAGMANGDLDSDSTDLEQLLGRPATDLHTALTTAVGH